MRLYVPLCLVVSLVLNIYYFTRPAHLQLPLLNVQPAAHHHRQRRPAAASSADYSQLTDLILVPGHGVYLGQDTPLNESSWYLLDSQRGEVGAFIQHIGRALEIVKEHEHSLVLFSGSRTRPGLGYGEGQGYYMVADRMGWLTEDVASRVMAEDFARDSLENVLFSVARFHEVTGNYPDRITVVGFEFKRRRFNELHRRALVYPKIRFNYVGIDPPYRQGRAESERREGYLRFQKDLYGCHSGLKSKKEARNPYRMRNGYGESCPEIRALLEYCPKDGVTVYDGELPWLS